MPRAGSRVSGPILSRPNPNYMSRSFLPALTFAPLRPFSPAEWSPNGRGGDLAPNAAVSSRSTLRSVP